jgi:hypothetical protein
LFLFCFVCCFIYFVQATVKTHDAMTMADILRLAIQNKQGLKQYGILQADVCDMPASPSQFVNNNQSNNNYYNRKTRAERLQSLPNVPTDDRGTEVASAITVAGIVTLCFLSNFLGFHDLTPYTNFLWISIVTLGVVDNFYDVLVFGSNLAMSTLNNNNKDNNNNNQQPLQNWKLPDKASLPLALGTGTITGTVTRGLTRLLSVNTERECQCEAAALFVAYTLGLPCFAFRPNSLEAAYLIAQSQQSSQSQSQPLSPLLSNTGILKVLIWLLAPVAMESMNHPQLICSDPREAMGLLQRLEENAGKNNIDPDALWWLFTDEQPEQEKQDLIKWAYHEADTLLRNNMKDVTEMSQRLTGGAATIGDCVAVMERW